MEMKQNFIILSAAPYSILKKETGEINEGVSIRYISADNLNPMIDEEMPENKGYKPVKASFPLSYLNKFPHAPALYCFHMSMKPDKDMKPVIKVKDVEFLNTLTVSAAKTA